MTKMLDEFAKAKLGDVIYAKRPGSTEPGHESGPFVVLANKGDKLLCFSGSSKSGNYKFELLGDYTDSFQIKYIYYGNINSINRHDFKHSLDTSLTTKDINLLKKFYGVYKSQFNNDNTFLNYFMEDGTVIIDRGDIVEYKKGYYIVLDSSDSNYILLPIAKYNKQSGEVSQKDLMDFKEKLIVPKSTKLKFMNKMKKESFDSLEAQLKTWNQDIQSMTLKKGYVIYYDKNVYYVYDVQGDNALCQAGELSYTREENGISVGNMFFIPTFHEVTSIDKNNKIDTVIGISSDTDQSKIESGWKNNSVENHETIKYNSQKTIPEIKVGTIIGFDDIDERYIALEIQGKKVIAINIKSLKKGEIVYNTFLKSDRKLIVDKNLNDEQLKKVYDKIDRINRRVSHMSEEQFMKKIPLEVGELIYKNGQYLYVYEVENINAKCLIFEETNRWDKDAISIGDNKYIKPSNKPVCSIISYGNKNLVVWTAGDRQKEKINKYLDNKLDRQHKVPEQNRYIQENESSNLRRGSIIETLDGKLQYYIINIDDYNNTTAISVNELLETGRILEVVFEEDDPLMRECKDVDQDYLMYIRDTLASVKENSNTYNK